MGGVDNELQVCVFPPFFRRDRDCSVGVRKGRCIRLLFVFVLLVCGPPFGGNLTFFFFRGAFFFFAPFAVRLKLVAVVVRKSRDSCAVVAGVHPLIFRPRIAERVVGVYVVTSVFGDAEEAAVRNLEALALEQVR